MDIMELLSAYATTTPAGEDGFSTTFFADFTVADHFGAAAVRDTFNRAFKEWKTDYRYLTDLVLVLNRKLWDHYTAGHVALSRLYNDLWEKAQDYAYKHLKGEQLDYFFRMTD